MGIRPMDRDTLRECFETTRRGKAFWNHAGRAMPVDADDTEQYARYARFNGLDCMDCGWRHLYLAPWDRLDEIGE